MLRVGEKQVWGLVDPEKTGPEEIRKESIYHLDYDAMLVGGTFHVYADFLVKDVEALKEIGHRVGIFAVNESQVTGNADFVLATLPVNSSRPVIEEFMGIINAAEERGVPAIPLLYVIRPGPTSIAMLLRPFPINPVYHVLSRYVRLAKRLSGAIYLEGGSGADKTIDTETIEKIAKTKENVPLIVGGGIRQPKDAEKVFRAGADAIVIGTVIEKRREDVVKGILSIRDKL